MLNETSKAYIPLGRLKNIKLNNEANQNIGSLDYDLSYNDNKIGWSYRVTWGKHIDWCLRDTSLWEDLEKTSLRD